MRKILALLFGFWRPSERQSEVSDLLHPGKGIRMINDAILPLGFATYELFRHGGYEGLLLFWSEPIELLEVGVTEQDIRFRAMMLDALPDSEKDDRIRNVKQSLRELVGWSR